MITMSASTGATKTKLSFPVTKISSVFSELCAVCIGEFILHKWIQGEQMSVKTCFDVGEALTMQDVAEMLDSITF